MTYTFVEDLNALTTPLPADSIVSRSIYRGPDANVTLFTFAAGQGLTEHTAARPALLYFLKGKLQLTLGDDTLSAAKGSWVHMPAHLPHSIDALEDSVMLLILI